MMKKCFFSCDWGTSFFRLRLIDVASGQSVCESTAEDGIASVYALWKKAGQEEKKRIHFYQSFIQQHIEKIEQEMGRTAGAPVIISGMASSSIGMIEIPYTQTPFSTSGEGLQVKKIIKTDTFPYELLIISGASTNTDTMRGEETQLIGAANEIITRKQLFIFTGTHSKHVTVEAGKAVDIETYMTGEFFALLAKKSILSNSVEEGRDLNNDENTAAFEQGVKESNRQNLLHSSFMVRTNQLFKRFSKTANYYYLSGLLIGTEINGLQKKQPEGITIVGDKKLLANYMLALKVTGMDAKLQTMDTAAATICGQLAVYRLLY